MKTSARLVLVPKRPEHRVEVDLDRSAFETVLTCGGIEVRGGPGSLEHAIVLGALIRDGRNADEKYELTTGAKETRRAAEDYARRELERALRSAVDPVFQYVDGLEAMCREGGRPFMRATVPEIPAHYKIAVDDEA